MMKSKWVAAALITSIAVNLLLLGFIVGQRGHGGAFEDPTRGFPRWARTLPESRQETLRPMLRSHRREMRAPVRSLRQRHDALREALRAEPFDRQALSDALAAMRSAQGELQTASDNAFVEFAVRLTPAERAAMLTDVRKPRRPSWRKPERPQ